MGKKRRQERLFWHSFCKTNKRRQLALLLVIFVIGAVDVDRKTFPVCYEMGRREGKAAQEKDFPFFFFFSFLRLARLVIPVIMNIYVSVFIFT